MSDADDPRADDPPPPPHPSERAWHNRVPSPFSPTPRGTTFLRALGAAALWGGVLGAFLAGVATRHPPEEATAADLVVPVAGPTLLAALLTWGITRRRRRPFRHLALIALPLFLCFSVLVDYALVHVTRR
ncbi:hypothetical protein [Streptomyces sp. B6B3]|uniref:hypothetical protein n=1 Tax=Streptomyces sp. B6B3 TaxID=3153570 RepID=UPI00325CCBDF